MKEEIFSTSIISWYDSHHRELPWRQTNDPYKIWLSEVILQQTRVAQGLPYYEAFIRAFPSVISLAKAPEKKVLRLWQGLGYYSRARNLHRCAKVIVGKFDGEFPKTFDSLKELPGIGDYTAAAIASIAFGESVAVVDGNVFRVLSRVFGIDHDTGTPVGKKYFTALANQLIDKDRPNVFNQALMEFGALHCTPRNPSCGACIFSKGCVANQKNLQMLLPVKTRKPKAATRYFYYFIIRLSEKILLRKREEKDIWRGLYDFYLIETSRNKRTENLINTDEFLRQAIIKRESKIYKHILSHQKLMVKFTEVKIPITKWTQRQVKLRGLNAYSPKEISTLPKPILIDRFLKDELFNE